MCRKPKIHIIFRGKYTWDFQWFLFCFFYYFVVSKNQWLKTKLKVFKHKLLWTRNLRKWSSLSAVLYITLHFWTWIYPFLSWCPSCLTYNAYTQINTCAHNFQNFMKIRFINVWDSTLQSVKYHVIVRIHLILIMKKNWSRQFKFSQK